MEVETGSIVGSFGTLREINPEVYPSFVHLIESEVIPVHTFTISSD